MIPKSKEAIQDYVVAGAFFVMGSLLPGNVLAQGFQAHMAGIAIGAGIGWLIKSNIDHFKGVAREDTNEKG